MKEREKNFIITTPMLFIIVWVSSAALMNAAQGVGDAPDDFNPKVHATVFGAVVISLYAGIYYGIYWLYGLTKKKSDSKTIDNFDKTSDLK